METILVIPDCHIPWHDKQAYKVMLDIASFQNELYPITEVLLLGDYADAYSISLHPKLPSHLQVSPRTLTDELVEVHYELTVLRALFPQAKITYLEGNHEYRLQKYIIAKAPELLGLVKTLPEYLFLKDLDIKWIPYGRHQLYRISNTNLYARHVPWDGGRHTALNSLQKGHISLLFGHTHRKQTASIKKPTGEELVACSMGNLVNSNAEIFDYMDHNDWGQGFGFVFVEGGDHYLNYIDIKKGKACYHGSMYG